MLFDDERDGFVSRVAFRSMAARFSLLKGVATAADVRSMRGNEVAWRREDMDRKHFVAALGFYRCAVAVVQNCYPV
jgi:hypothetical protein